MEQFCAAAKSFAISVASAVGLSTGAAESSYNEWYKGFCVVKWFVRTKSTVQLGFRQDYTTLVLY